MNFPNTRKCLGILVLISSCLTACGQEAKYSGDPVGVDRNARPRIVVNGRAAQIDHFKIERLITTAREVSAFTNSESTDLAPSLDPYFNQVGILISTIEKDAPRNPGRVDGLEVWMRQDTFHAYYRPCTPEEKAKSDQWLDQMREKMRADKIPEDEIILRQRGLRKNCQEQQRVPLHPFRGYLEVDGMPIGPDMTFQEVQARRKQLGLQPLRRHPLDVDGSDYRAYKTQDPTEGWDQRWTFRWQDDKLPENRVLVSIGIP